MHSKTIIAVSMPYAWQKAVEFVRKSKHELEFGGTNEEKHAVDSQVSIILDEHAIKEVLNYKKYLNVHPSDPFCDVNRVNAYLEEYKDGFDSSKFSYTYFKELKTGFLDKDGNPIDQLNKLKEGLAKQIYENRPSNRNVAILYNPAKWDMESSSPCFNEVSIRYERNHMASIHVVFRSHDLFQAWEANLIAIVNMLYKDVIAPSGCDIAFYSEHNISLHIYNYNLKDANEIKNVGINPLLKRVQYKYNNQ